MEKNLKMAFVSSLIHHTSGITWVADEHLNLVFANNNFCQYFSVGRHPAGPVFASKVPEEIWDEYYHHHMHVLETGECITREVALQTADESKAVFHLDMFPVRRAGKWLECMQQSWEAGLKLPRERAAAYWSGYLSSEMGIGIYHPSPYTTMKDFVWTFGIDSKTITLFFKGVVSPLGNKYFVSSPEGQKNGVVFEMKQLSNSRWVVLQPAPEWAGRIENMLAGAIEKVNGD